LASTLAFNNRYLATPESKKGINLKIHPEKKRVEKMKTEVRKIKTEENGRIECSSNKRTYS